MVSFEIAKERLNNHIGGARRQRGSFTFDPAMLPDGIVYRFTDNFIESRRFYNDNANPHAYPIYLIGRTDNIIDPYLNQIRLNDDNEREYSKIIREGKKPVLGLWIPPEHWFRGDSNYSGRIESKCTLDTVCVEGVDTRYDDSEAKIAREEYSQDAVFKISSDGSHKTIPETRTDNLREALGE